MTLMQEMRTIRESYAAVKDVLDHNCKLIDISEGNLLKYLQQAMMSQISAQSYEQCRHRLAPINLLNKIMDKLSGIYQPGPTRRIVGGTEADQKLLDWYLEYLKPNEVFQQAARSLSMCKGMLVQPYAHKLVPRMRVVQNDHFFPLSYDKVDPLAPTHIVTVDYKSDDKGAPCVYFTAYTDTEVLIFNEKEEVDLAAMIAMNNPEGVNPVRKIPFVYRSLSSRRLMASPDSDILAMTLLIPVLFSDLNYAVMFQAFSLLYGIDVDDQGITIAPNAFLRFKSDPNSDKKPELGVIKPSVDIEATLTHIQTQLSLWLNSRGIRPGAIGTLTKDNFANGISKMIDEMDTFEARQKLVTTMQGVEAEFWDLLINHVHPSWVEQGVIENRALFSHGCKVQTHFSNQAPMVDRGKMVADLKLERDAGFIDTERCIQKLNPMETEQEIAERVAAAEADRKDRTPPALAAVDNSETGDNSNQQDKGAA